MRLVSNLTRAMGAAAALALFALGAQAQTIGCEVGVANGGIVPSSGSGGGGVFPTTLPTVPTSFTLNVAALPPGSTVVTEVKLIGLTHTWIADVQWVLTDPSGASHNLWVRGTSGITSCDWNGNYTIVPQCTGLGQTLPTTCTGTSILPPGAYDQFFGTGATAWPSGTNGINNTPLSSIAAATGVWTLTAYDWAGGDTGNLTSFDVCFGTPVAPSIPTTAPTLLTPANAAIANNPVTLTWSSVTCATTYDVDIDGSVTTGVVGTSFNAPVLAPGLHNWRVRGTNSSGSGPYSTSSSFTVPAPPPPSTCVTNGTGAGLIPATGDGGTGAVWPLTLPATPYTNSYNVVVPAGATQVVKVELIGAAHTWIGDLQAVLTDPTGGQHNLVHRVSFTTAGFGLNCDLGGGTYSIYESSGSPWPTTCPTGGVVPAGDYVQSFGTWTSGDASIFNTPLSAIPVSSGMWTLTIYDWAGGDSGSITDWQVCFDSGPAGPAVYCTAGTSTNGCVPAISGSAQPSVSFANPCNITVANVEGQKSGLIYYGINNTGFSPTPWSGTSTSFLCVKGPTQRTPAQNSGGTNGSCNGALVLDWNAYQTATPSALGNPWSVGNKAYVQGWYRDPPAPKTTNLSDALEMTYVP